MGQQCLNPAKRIDDAFVAYEVRALYVFRHIDDTRNGNRIEGTHLVLDQLAKSVEALDSARCAPGGWRDEWRHYEIDRKRHNPKAMKAAGTIGCRHSIDEHVPNEGLGMLLNER